MDDGWWVVRGGRWEIEISSNRPERKACNSWREGGKACNSWTEPVAADIPWPVAAEVPWPMAASPYMARGS